MIAYNEALLLFLHIFKNALDCGLGLNASYSCSRYVSM